MADATQAMLDSSVRQPALRMRGLTLIVFIGAAIMAAVDPALLRSRTWWMFGGGSFMASSLLLWTYLRPRSIAARFSVMFISLFLLGILAFAVWTIAVTRPWERGVEAAVGVALVIVILLVNWAQFSWRAWTLAGGQTPGAFASGSIVNDMEERYLDVVVGTIDRAVIQPIVTAWIGGRDPTRHWVRDPNQPLVLDLDQHALSGVRLGEPVERLSFLGRTDSATAAARGVLEYEDRGLWVNLDDGGRVASFVIDILSGGSKRARPFSGEVQFRGVRLQLDAQWNEAQFVDTFGEPQRRDAAPDGEDATLFYDLPGAGAGVEWQVSFFEDRLEDVTVLAK